MDNKKRRIGVFIAAMLAISAFAAMTPMTSAAPKPKPSDSFQASSADIVVSNNIYDVTVEDTLGSDGIGTYTVSTGSGFPQPNQDILFGGADHNAWSSYLTVRSYTTKTHYVTTTSSPGTTIYSSKSRSCQCKYCSLSHFSNHILVHRSCRTRCS